ncbi:MAG: serine hydrolase domain-containing protein, partial [Acidimicrobiia bacterium]
MTTPIDEKKIQSRLRSLIRKHKVPGAALGILSDGQVTEVAAGVVNLNTGVKATPDTVWQIGSMTKAWTATVVMQLVDEGLVDLDAPIQKYLPDFKLADPDVSANVTMRHLLAHTSGMDGDNFEDFGRGDDCLEKYVASCAALKQTHALGETMSYCNTGYSIAGRVIEVLTDKLWDQAMKERLFAPLGMTHTSTLPEETLLFSNAVGHVSLKPGDPAQVAPIWMLPRICGPMGLINSTVRDCLKFAQLHLNNGRTQEGAQVLSSDSVQQMQASQVEVPDRYTLGSHWGVGWILFDWDGHRLYGHDGNTIGQAAFLRVLPEANVAIAMLTNGGRASSVYREIYSEILTELGGVKVPPLPKMPKKPVELDLQPYAGAYERLAVRIDLQIEGNKLEGTITSSGPLASLSPNPVTNITLTPVTSDTFLMKAEGEEATPLPAVFYA